MRGLVLALLVSLVGLPLIARSAPLPDAAWEALIGKEITLILASGAQQTGSLLGHDDEFAVLQLPSGEVASVPRADVVDVLMAGVERASESAPPAPVEPAVEPASASRTPAASSAEPEPSAEPDPSAAPDPNGSVASLVVTKRTASSITPTGPYLELEPSILFEPSRCHTTEATVELVSRECRNRFLGGVRAVVHIAGPLVLRFDAHGGVDHVGNWTQFALNWPAQTKGQRVPATWLFMQARLGLGVHVATGLARFQVTMGAQVEQQQLSAGTAAMVRAANLQPYTLPSTWLGPFMMLHLEVGAGLLRGGPLVGLDTRIGYIARVDEVLYDTPREAEEAKQLATLTQPSALHPLLGGRLVIDTKPVGITLEVAHSFSVLFYRREQINQAMVLYPYGFPEGYGPHSGVWSGIGSLRVLLGARIQLGPQ